MDSSNSRRNSFSHGNSNSDSGGSAKESGSSIGGNRRGNGGYSGSATSRGNPENYRIAARAYSAAAAVGLGIYGFVELLIQWR